MNNRMNGLQIGDIVRVISDCSRYGYIGRVIKAVEAPPTYATPRMKVDFTKNERGLDISHVHTKNLWYSVDSLDLVHRDDQPQPMPMFEPKSRDTSDDLRVGVFFDFVLTYDHLEEISKLGEESETVVVMARSKEHCIGILNKTIAVSDTMISAGHYETLLFDGEIHYLGVASTVVFED